MAALLTLRAQGDILRTLPQPLYEFWVVATRPLAKNGLGLSTSECDQTLAGIEALFPLLSDTPTLFSHWRALVVAHDCHGEVVHDARYVAALRGHSLIHLLTFNTADFSRFPGLTVLDPTTLITPPPPGANP